MINKRTITINEAYADREKTKLVNSINELSSQISDMTEDLKYKSAELKRLKKQFKEKYG